MANIIVAVNFGPPPARFAGQKLTDEFTSNIETSFGMIGYKGKVWSVRFRDKNVPMMREDEPDTPCSAIEVIFIAASRFKSKVYYPHYTEGSSEKPTCYSSTAITPDPNAQEPQASACAACKRNVMGSGTNGRGKACSDSKRMAIVPANDIENIRYGGPMLLRVPAGSLNAFGIYADQLQKSGYPLFAVVTRVSFEPKEAYPKFRFTPLRVLTDEEIDQIVALRDNLQVKRILAEGVENEAAPAEEHAPDGDEVVIPFGQAPAPTLRAPQTAERAVITPRVTESPKSEAVVDLDNVIDPDIEAKLDALLPLTGLGAAHPACVP